MLCGFSCHLVINLRWMLLQNCSLWIWAGVRETEIKQTNSDKQQRGGLARRGMLQIFCYHMEKDNKFQENQVKGSPAFL